MPNWEGSRARADALAVGCGHCHAIVGQPCINIAIPSKPPLWHFAAHTCRVNAAARVTDEVF